MLSQKKKKEYKILIWEYGGQKPHHFSRGMERRTEKMDFLSLVGIFRIEIPGAARWVWGGP
jgi:hypothetical protein